jgi:hypothetical protein
MADARVDQLLREHQALERARAPYEADWRDIAHRLAPNLELWPPQDPSNTARQPPEIFDAPRGPLQRFAAALNGLLTPAGSKWHGFMVPGTKDDELDTYLEGERDTLFDLRYASKSNFARGNGEVWRGIGIFGNGVMLVDDRPGRPLAYQAVPLRECYWALDVWGRVDRVHRVLSWYGYQMLQFFKGRLPAGIEAAAVKDRMKPFKVLHCVKPREDYRPGRLDGAGMRFAGYYLSLDQEKVILEEGGYRSLPYAVARYDTGSGEAYARGPSHAALPSMKMTNTMKRQTIAAGNRIAEPPLATHSRDVTVDLSPHAINPGLVTPDGRPLVMPFGVGERLDVPIQLLEMEKKEQAENYLDNLWQILEEKPAATATEILQRAQEKGDLLSPTAGVMQGEYLGAIVDRETEVYAARGVLFREPPEVLVSAGGTLAIDYDNPLTRAQKASAGIATLRVLEGAAAAVQFDPLARHTIDGEAVIRELRRSYGAPGEILRKPEQVKALRDEELQQQQLQSIVAAAPAASSAAANLAKLSGGTAPPA